LGCRIGKNTSVLMTGTQPSIVLMTGIEQGIKPAPPCRPMKSTLFTVLCLLLSPAGCANLQLSSPLEHQVIQRGADHRGTLAIRGTGLAPGADLEARVVGEKLTGEWRKLDPVFEGDRFRATLEAPAGGWFRLEVRASDRGKVIARSAVNRVGIGEVFVVAGQSNSANHGEEKLATRTGRVATFDGEKWRLAKDPQPGASGSKGSFLPPLGDALAIRFGVPIGFIACGIGATSVREWLPEGATFPHPPTIEARVRRRTDGTWESKGEAFEVLAARMKAAGPAGFRAVLWHQGESDANQRDATRTLPGALYREYLERVIRESRRAAGWEVPWMVARASYHVPGDEACPDIRAAQASLWEDGIALEGPDTDALKGDLRENGGQGVHFSGKGQRAHAAAWERKIAAWLERS
jgi:hypothetical protein